MMRLPRASLHAVRWFAAGIVLASVCADAQTPKDTGPGTGSEPEPSRCVTEAAIQVTANPSTVAFGQSTLVSWSVGLPDRCPHVRVRLNGEPVGVTGSRSFVPPRASTYSVTISETHLGVHGQRSASTQVRVIYPPRVVIDPSTQRPAQVLVGVLMESTNEQQTVELCDVEIDLTGFIRVEIGSNRALIGAPGCERTPRRLGPRVFVTDARGRAALFLVWGDNVRISGFRLEGPTTYIAQGDRKEKGIVISPAAAAEPLRNVEVSNMEIFHWSGVGVQVEDNVALAERGRLFNTNPGAVRIRDNFFHHNRHGAGEGYGVDVAAGGYALIEQNVFDENRHAIAGGVSRHKDALDYSGYTARDNLILAGGGLHCLDHAKTGGIIGGIVGGIAGAIAGGLAGGLPGAIIGGLGGAAAGAGAGIAIGSMCWHTHQIDMHGDKSAFPGGEWCCGTAGETMIIERNTILYTGGPVVIAGLNVPVWSTGPAIKIRGNPADKAVVDNNVFKHESRGDAIDQNGEPGWGDNITKPIDVRPNNVFDADPTTELGHCDFFGDGTQDDFMATGVTWWARSPVTDHWRYLNTMKEKLPELQLGTIDGDAICDVAPRTPRPGMIPRIHSKSGTSPWRPTRVVGPQ